MDAAARVQKARVQLLLRHPFFGNLALHLVPTSVAADWCTFATDGRRFFYNPSWVAQLDDRQLEYCVAHSVMHCGLRHFDRRGLREERRWDLAADLAVNAILLAPRALSGEGMRGPKGAVFDKQLVGLSAEQIYVRLKPASRRRGAPDRHLAGGGAQEGTGGDGRARQGESGDGGAEPTEDSAGGAEKPQDGDGAAGAEDARPDAPGQSERSFAGPPPQYIEGEGEVWQGRLLRAAIAARMQGKLPASMGRVIDGLLEPQLPWYELLAQYIHSRYRNDYRLIPPNRRFLHLGIYLPSVFGEYLELVVAVDTSGSISDAMLRTFLSELSGIMSSIPSYRVELLGCDAGVSTHRTFESPDRIDTEPLSGGGGTDFRPVFEKVSEECWTPDALIYLTDGYGTFPERAPDYPVLWLICGSNVEPPFGRRLSLELPVVEQHR